MLETPPKPAQQRNGGSKLAPQQLLSTRRGTIIVALVAALFAAVVLMIFLGQYKDSVGDSSEPVKVLVVKRLIEKGTPGEAIVRAGLWRSEEIPKDQVKAGALTSADLLSGKVASKTLYPGQQLTAGTFAAEEQGVRSTLRGRQRAMTVSLDPAHGLIGNVEAGDRVDVLGGYLVKREGASVERPMLRTLVQNAQVLDAPKEEPNSGAGASASSKEKQVTVRVTDEQAAAIAFTSDNGKVWITLRPPAGARESRVSVVTLESLLLGLKPIRLKAKEGR